MHLEGGRNFHESHFVRHVEDHAEVFWMKKNPFRDALDNISFVLEERKDLPLDEASRESAKKLLRDVYRSCDHYLVTYYDLILAVQNGRDITNRENIQEADRSRRSAHIALTTNIRVLARNLLRWEVDIGSLRDFVIVDDMDSQRTVIGNYALNLAFLRYVSS